MKELIERLEAQGGESVVADAPAVDDEALLEAERARKDIVVKAADAMVNSPAVMRYLNKLPLAGYEAQLQQTIESMLIQLLQMKGVGVSGGSQALRAIRGLGRGTMPTG